MKRQLLTWGLVLSVFQLLSAQLRVDRYNDSSFETLVKNRISDKSVFIHKVDLINGSNFTAGAFSNGVSTVGFHDGIVLSTGFIGDILGIPTDFASSGFNAEGFSPFNTLYNTGGNFDATRIRIEFTPLSDSIFLNYVLGSELYEIEECTNENDWIGVFIRPENEWGSSNWTNLASIPNKPNVPVTPNTVNGKTNSLSSSECLRLDSNWQENSIYYKGAVEGTTLNGVTFPLMTRPMKVTPGVLYELQIVIADGRSDTEDSAIFLKGKSLRSKPYDSFIRIDKSYSLCTGETIIIGETIINNEGTYLIKKSDENAPIDTFIVATVSADFERVTINHSICMGESIIIAGQTFMSNATINDTIVGSGCDSIITHTISVRNTNRSEIYHQLCDGNTLFIGDTSFTASGLYEELRLNENGCDELILHHFDFSSPIFKEIIYNSCQGDTIIVNGISYNSSTTFEQTYSTSSGCDSIVQINIVFDEVYHKIVQHKITSLQSVPFDTLFIQDTFFTRNDIYFERKIIQNGCDTLIEHRIFFDQLELVYDENLSKNYCLGDTIKLFYNEDYFVRDIHDEWVQKVDSFITGGMGKVYKSTININSYEESKRLDDVKDLSYIGAVFKNSWPTDLDISISCPNESTVKLQQHEAINQGVYLNFSSFSYWSPYQTQTWSESRTNPAFQYQFGAQYGSYESLTNLIGCPLNGNWTLTVEDFWGRNDGIWDQWSIGFPTKDLPEDEDQIAIWGWGWDEEKTYPELEFLRNNNSTSDLKIVPHAIGKYLIKGAIVHSQFLMITEPVFTFTVTDPYTDPSQFLDTLFCSPTFLYDTLITESGTYNLKQQHPDYCTSIPIIANVTIISPDSTFLSDITCEFSDSDLMVETLTNQYGCDSLIFTGVQLVVDTVFTQEINCLPNISQTNRSFEIQEVIVDNGCDYVSVIEHLDIPIDTVRQQKMVCDPNDEGVSIEVYASQFGCDSVVIINNILALDTTYLHATTCQFEAVGIQQEILPNQFGCDSLIITHVTIAVDTIYSASTACGTVNTPVSSLVNIENINVQDGCDYVSVETILSAPTDTLFLITPSCQLRDSLPHVLVLHNQYGCDSVVITDYNLRLDTIISITDECVTGINVPEHLTSSRWEINEAACDTFRIDMINLYPLDTSFVTTASCNPQDTGTFLLTLVNQYQCDSLVITEVLFNPDTIFLETNTCYPQDSGWHFQVLGQADGCQLLEWEYRRYQPLDYEWLVRPDTCGFGQGSATFIPGDTNLQYTFNWDGPAVDINPAAIFRGVYTVTITAEGDFYSYGCIDTTNVIIGNISSLPTVTYTYTANDLRYTFNSELVEADSFYWDFGDGNTSRLANPVHVYAHTGTYTACLFAKNRCGIEQDCEVIKTIKGYPISGKVETAPLFPSTTGISGVELTLAATGQTVLDATSISGDFSFEDQLEGYDYQLHPQKEDLPLNGLDVIDLLKIAQATNGSRILNAPYELLAADVDCNENITIEDALYLNDLLLGEQDGFPNACSSWLFWPQSYIFSNPQQPFVFETAITLSNLQQPALANDFFGLKRGDLGGNADTKRSPSSIDTLFLTLENGSVDSGDTLQLDFKVRNFNELIGLQFELVFDTFAFAFTGIELGDLATLKLDHFGLNEIHQGSLRCVWVDLLGQAHSLEDNDILFSLHLLAKQKIIDRKNKIGLTNRDLATLCFNADLEENTISLILDDLTDITSILHSSFQLDQNRPNPFNHTTIIPFKLPSQANINLKIYNQLGQLVWQKEGRYPSGISEVEVRLNKSGLYYYSINTPWGTATRKMIGVE